jgi:hypothetical protein
MKGLRCTFHGSRLSLLVALLSLAIAAGASAHTGGGYDLTWSTVDGGGYTWSEGGGYALGGTAGQPDAGMLSGGGYTLAGGFWAGAAAQHRLYLPLVMKAAP